MTIKLLITKWSIVELCFVGLGLLVDRLWTWLQPSYSLQSIDNMLHSVLYLSFWACERIVNNYWCCPSPTVIETRVSVVPTGKLKSLPEEISWSHEVFLCGFRWFCIVLYEGSSSYKEMPEFSCSVVIEERSGSAPPWHELFRDYSLKWSIYTPVWQKNVHS